MTDTEAKWAERVRSWRASGKTAEEFAGGLGFQASTLRYWASRLKTAPARAAKAPSIVRVVRPASALVAREAPPGASSLEVCVGVARVVVRHGFDAELLRDVVVALGGGR